MRYTHGASNSLTSAREVFHDCCRLWGALYTTGYWLKQEYNTIGPGIWELCKAHVGGTGSKYLLVGFPFLIKIDKKCCWKLYRQKDKVRFEVNRVQIPLEMLRHWGYLGQAPMVMVTGASQTIRRSLSPFSQTFCLKLWKCVWGLLATDNNLREVANPGKSRFTTWSHI